MDRPAAQVFKGAVLFREGETVLREESNGRNIPARISQLVSSRCAGSSIKNSTASLLL